jgi:hypothetical protein
VKRTNATVHVFAIAACLSNTRCGGDTGSAAAPDASTAGGGGGGAAGSHGTGASGAAGFGFGGFAGFGGFGGFPFPDGGLDHDCPVQRPLDSSSCSTRSTCRYPDGFCNCVRVDEQDASGREWNCFDTMPRDAGICPAKPPSDGDMCMNLGQKCAGSNLSTNCTCVAEDGNLTWRC